MKNKYDEISAKHQKMVNDFPMRFAFNDNQFEQSMKELGLKPTDTDKVYSIGGGCFIRKTDLEKFNKLWDDIRKEHNDLINADKTGEGYIKDMFVSELENHEYSYTHDLTDTLDALELTRKQISENKALNNGLQLAIKEVLNREKESEHEYE